MSLEIVNECVSPTLYFSINSSIQQSKEYLHILREKAEQLEFEKVDSLVEFNTDEISNTNSYYYVKKHSRALVTVDDRVFSVAPNSFKAFSSKLINGQNLWIGLSIFSDEITILDKTVKIASKKRAIWSSWVNSISPTCLTTPKDCVLSHLSVVYLLRHGEAVGLDIQVKDPTDYYYTSNAQKLSEIAHRIAGNTEDKYEYKKIPQIAC